MVPRGWSFHCSRLPGEYDFRQQSVLAQLGMGVELDDMNRIFLFTDLAFSERLSEKTWYHALGGGLTTMTRLGRISVAAGVPISEGFTAMVIHTRLESTF